MSLCLSTVRIPGGANPMLLPGRRPRLAVAAHLPLRCEEASANAHRPARKSRMEGGRRWLAGKSLQPVFSFSRACMSFGIAPLRRAGTGTSVSGVLGTWASALMINGAEAPMFAAKITLTFVIP